MELDRFVEKSSPFIQWLLDWEAGLQPVSLAELIGSQPERVGIVCVDVIKGFCTVGPLSSPRVNQIVEPICQLFEIAWAQGIRDVALPHDAHSPDSLEFNQYGPHCIPGTAEAEVVDELATLPFFDQLTVIEKNCINAGLNAEFATWLAERTHIQTWIVVGDCTDICAYQIALHLRVSANEQQRETRVIVPVNTVDTYDLPVNTAQEIGAVPHDADLLHLVFLYHMMLNGIEIYTEITE